MQIARRGNGDDRHAAVIHLLRVKLNLVRDDNDRWALAAVRIQSERADAAGDDQPDVTLAQLVFAARVDDRLHHLRVADRDFQQDCLRRAKQAVDVFLQLEDAAVVGADALEDAVTVKQSVIEHAHLGVLLVVIFSVDVNFHTQKPWHVIGRSTVTQLWICFDAAAIARRWRVQRRATSFGAMRWLATFKSHS